MILTEVLVIVHSRQKKGLPNPRNWKKGCLHQTALPRGSHVVSGHRKQRMSTDRTFFVFVLPNGRITILNNHKWNQLSDSTPNSAQSELWWSTDRTNQKLLPRLSEYHQKQSAEMMLRTTSDGYLDRGSRTAIRKPHVQFDYTTWSILFSSVNFLY